MRDLNEKHSGAYMSKVLLECLEEFNIKYNIKRYLIFFNFFKELLLI